MPASSPVRPAARGGLAPARCWSPRTRNGEYAPSSISPVSAFDLTDRGVKGRDAPGPLDGFVYTERGVYRPGEDVHVAALVRDAAGNAATLPRHPDRLAPRRRRVRPLHR